MLLYVSTRHSSTRPLISVLISFRFTYTLARYAKIKATTTYLITKKMTFHVSCDMFKNSSCIYLILHLALHSVCSEGLMKGLGRPCHETNVRPSIHTGSSSCIVPSFLEEFQISLLAQPSSFQHLEPSYWP